MATPHFYINPPPPFQVYPPFLAKNVIPPPLVTQFLEGPTHPFDSGGEGFQLCFVNNNILVITMLNFELFRIIIIFFINDLSFSTVISLSTKGTLILLHILHVYIKIQYAG